MRFNEGLSTFVKSFAGFFRPNKYTNLRRFCTIFCPKRRIFSLQKVHENTLLSKLAIQHIFKQKLKVGNFYCLPRKLKAKYCPKFWTCLK